MIINEKESKTISCLRNPLCMMNELKKGNCSPIENMTTDEIIALYHKMDAVIEEEGSTKRFLGNYDEMYVIELNGVKDTLLKEYNKRKSIEAKRNYNEGYQIGFANAIDCLYSKLKFKLQTEGTIDKKTLKQLIDDIKDN